MVSVCVTADRGDGSEMYTLSLTSINVTSQGILSCSYENSNWILAAHNVHVEFHLFNIMQASLFQFLLW